jgi:hypothetical protein
MTLWICCKGGYEGGPCWELQGIFDTQERAVEACKGDEFWIGEVELNREFPVERCDWPGIRYYPTITDALGAFI